MASITFSRLQKHCVTEEDVRKVQTVIEMIHQNSTGDFSSAGVMMLDSYDCVQEH